MIIGLLLLKAQSVPNMERPKEVSVVFEIVRTFMEISTLY